MAIDNSRESGLGLVGLFLGSTAIAVAVLGTVGGLMTSLKLVIDTKDEGIANGEALAVIDQFRRSAEVDFDAAIASFSERTIRRSGDLTIYSRIILDETRFDPPIDLNGDGDFNDSDLSPSQVYAAYLETAVTWSHDRSLSFVTLIPRKGNSAKKRWTREARPR